MSRVRSIVATSAAERQLIARGATAHEQMFPGLHFDANVWSTKGRRLMGSCAAGGNIRWSPPSRFTTTPLALRFSRVVKAVGVLNLSNAGTLANAARAACLLWASLMRRRGGNADAFSWEGLEAADFEEGEGMLLEHGLGKQTVYRTCLQWSTLIERLNAAGICRRINPAFAVGKPEVRDRQTLLGQQQQVDRMMSDDAIDAVARLFAGDFELEPTDRLLVCFVALLFATGLRFREVASLPVDALRKERSQYFVHYFKAKSRAVIEEKIALSSSQAKLARVAIRRAIGLTRVVRRSAAALSASPDIFPVPSHWRTVVSESQLARFAGMTSQAAHSHFERAIELVAGEEIFDVKTLQEIMQAERSNESVVGVCATASGAWLALDKALFIAFVTHRQRAPRTRIHVTTIRHSTILNFCASAPGRPPSIFERFDLRDRQGNLIGFTPHAIRHYVTTKAAQAGVPDAHLVRWQRREHVGDLQAYKHLTAEERVAQIKAALRTGRLHGEVAQTFVELAPEDADRYLESVVQAVHVTPLGLCLHDFSAAPCPKALNCVKRCRSYVFDPADTAQRAALEKLRDRNTMALQRAKAAVESGQTLAKAWVAEFEETIDGIERVLGDDVDTQATTRFEKVR